MVDATGIDLNTGFETLGKLQIFLGNRPRSKREIRSKTGEDPQNCPPAEQEIGRGSAPVVSQRLADVIWASP